MNQINPAADNYGMNFNECTKNDCGDVLNAFHSGLYSRELSPIDCLTAYTDIYRNLSNVIMVADYDFLSNKPTIEANTTNTLLFTKYIRLNQDFRFWNGYNWLCGNTNSFDCKLNLVYIDLYLNRVIGRLPSLWLKDPSIMKNWNILGWKISKCYSRVVKLENSCAVRSSPPIMIGKFYSPVPPLYTNGS
jgi:hypothetical protein